MSTGDELISIGDELSEGDGNEDPTTTGIADDSDPITTKLLDSSNGITPTEHDALGEDGRLRDDVGNKVTVEVGGSDGSRRYRWVRHGR